MLDNGPSTRRGGPLVGRPGCLTGDGDRSRVRIRHGGVRGRGHPAMDSRTCAVACTQQWTVALVLWLVNRFADGLDGAIARRRGPTDLGGFLDIMADFAVYGAMLVAIGFALPEAQLAALVVLLMYYLSGSAFLAWSSLATKNGVGGDGRSLVFPAGLAEGSETVVSYVVLLLFVSRASEILWIWAAVVGVTAVQRLVYVVRTLPKIQTAHDTRSISDVQ